MAEKFFTFFSNRMFSLDLSYLRRIEKRTTLADILREPKFVEAQNLFFSTVKALGGTVDFDIADMREVHAIAALGTEVKNKHVLDIGCGSTEPYVLENTFRDSYPPFFAEMLVMRGAKVTGIDIRTNPTAHYDHRVLDLTKQDWKQSLRPSYDIIACFNVFNAPSSPFEHDALLCERLLDDLRGLLSSDGLLIVTLRDDLFSEQLSKEQQHTQIQSYASSKKLNLLHCDGNCAWMKPIEEAN